MDTPILRKSKRFLFFVVALFLLPLTSNASELGCNHCNQWYPILTLGVGGAIAKVDATTKFRQGESTYNYSSQGQYNTQSFFDIAIGAEYRFHPCWSFQGLLAFSQPRSFIGKGRVTQGVDVETANQYSYRYQVLARQLLLEGKLLGNVNQFIHPYALLGIGVASTTAYNYNVTIIPPWTTMSPLYSEHSSTSFSYGIGAGFDVDIDPLKHFRGGLGYRFTNFGRTSLGSGILNTTTVSNTLSQSNLYAHEIFVQLTYIAF